MRGREEEPCLHHGVKPALHHAPREGQPDPRGLTLPFPSSRLLPPLRLHLHVGWAPSHRLMLDSFLGLLQDHARAQVLPHSPDPMGNPWGLAPASPFLPHHAQGGWGGSGQVPLRLSSRQHPHRIGPFPREHSMGTGSASTTGILSREEMLQPPATPCSLCHCQCDRRQLHSTPLDPERHPAPAPSLFYLFPAAASSRAFLPSLSFPFFLYFGTACCNKYPNR